MSILERFTSSKKKQAEVTIFPATEQDPAFVVTAAVLSQRAANEAYEACSENNVLVMKKYAAHWGKKVVLGWRGLTIRNFIKLLPDQHVDEGELRTVFRIEGDGEIPYRADLATDLWKAVENDVFAGKIKEAVDEARDMMKEEARIAAEKKAS